jgi:hypothetical protein
MPWASAAGDGVVTVVGGATVTPITRCTGDGAVTVTGNVASCVVCITATGDGVVTVAGDQTVTVRGTATGDGVVTIVGGETVEVESGNYAGDYPEAAATFGEPSDVVAQVRW